MTNAGKTMIATYDLRLVVLSVVIALAASYTALDLAGRVTEAQGNVRQLWLFGGAIAMGIGIWSMHFIAMLAYNLPEPAYDLPIVLLSMAVAVVVSGAALFLVSRERMGTLPLLTGGVFMGLGIALMHYTGMAAMRLEATAEYDAELVALSIVIAIAASLTSLWLAFQLRAESTIAGIVPKLGSALIMGSAIAGMHYTAMAAVSFKPANQFKKQFFQGMDNSGIGVAIGLATLVILILALLVCLVDRCVSAQTARAEALRQSEERFRSFVQHSSDMIKILEADATIRYQSPSVERILGYKPEDLVGKNAFEYVHPEDVLTVQAAFEDVIQKPGVTVRVEYRFRHADNSWVYLESIANNLLSDTNIKGVVVNCRDITERKQAEEVLLRIKVTEAAKQELEKEITERKRAEEALRESEERYRRLVELSPNTIFVESSGKFVFVNSAGAKLLGAANPKELIGKSVLDFVHPDYREIVTSRMRQLTEEAKEVPLLEEKLIRLDGTVLDIEEAATLFNYEGKPAAQVVVRDITEHKQAQAALEQLNANLEHQVQERTAQLQQALDFEAMLKRITDKVRDSLGESQILQTAVQELVLVLGVSCCNTALYNLEKGTSTICYEYATLNPGAQARVAQIANFPEIYQQLLQGQYCQFCSITPNPIRGRVAMLACPILDDQGVLGDLWLINHKEHAFNELEIRLVQQVANQCAIAIRQARLYQAATAQVEELENLSQLKDDFLSTVSHELRTPVTNMKMAIRMLKIAPTAPARERYLEILQNECAREIELINTLLDLQQLEAASYLISREVVSLQDWLPSIIEPFHVRTQERQQILRVDLPPSLPQIISDRASLGRILAELLNNACKYTPEQGEIGLSVECKVLSVECQVEELPPPTPHGIPHTSTIFTIRNQAEIPATELPRIFEKFYRVPSADPWKQGGTGLGLALVQKLVKKLEGEIHVESSGGWTTFTVQLPAIAVFSD